MAVYRRGYQRYEGTLTGRWARFMVLPRFAWQRLFQQRLVVLLLIVCLDLASSLRNLYLSEQSCRPAESPWPAVPEFLEVNGNFFIIFMNVQAFFAVFLAALTGPGLIAPDLANNALPLYFSRPLTRAGLCHCPAYSFIGLAFADYLGAGTVCFSECKSAWSDKPWFSTHWKLGIGMIAGFPIWILLVSMVALASSAYVRVRVVAGGLVLGFFFILSGVSTMVNGVFRVHLGICAESGMDHPSALVCPA